MQCRDRGQQLGDVSGQQFVDAIDFVIGDVREHVFEVGARVDTIELARPYAATLDVSNLDATPTQRMPAIVDFNFLPDMGKMNGKLSFRGCMVFSIHGEPPQQRSTPIVGQFLEQWRRYTALGMKYVDYYLMGTAYT